MDLEEPKGTQVGSGNTQHNTFMPQEPGGPAAVVEGEFAASITAGDNATITNTQKKTNLKFSVPVFGPLFALMAAHPVIAGAATIAVVVGAGVGGAVAEHAASSTSPGSAPTGVVRGFKMNGADISNPNLSGASYDFTKTPPADDGAADSVTFSNGYVYGRDIGPFTGSGTPTASGCLSAVKQAQQKAASDNANTVQVFIQPGTVVCYVDTYGRPGYFIVTVGDASPVGYIVVDTAHL